MRFILLACLLCTLSLAHGDVYKWVDEAGVIHFSDQPVPGAERVTIKPVQTVTLPPLPSPVTAGNEAADDQEQVPYTSLAIVQPAEDEAVRANDGSVSVKLNLEPSLQEGHSIALDLNGHRIATRTNTNFVLENVPRGAHTLRATVVDDQGKALVEAKPVSFHVLRTASG